MRVPVQKVALRSAHRSAAERELKLPKLKDPRYVVLSVRRDKNDKLTATAYDSRSANEYQVTGCPIHWMDSTAGAEHSAAQRHLSYDAEQIKDLKENKACTHKLRISRQDIQDSRQDIQRNGGKKLHDQYDDSSEYWPKEGFKWDGKVWLKGEKTPAKLGYDVTHLEIKVVQRGEENVKDPDFVDPIMWSIYKRQMALGEQITPRIKLVAFTSPLVKGGSDEYVGEVEIPVSTITGLGGLVSDKWTPLYNHTNEKVGMVRLKCSFDEGGQVRIATTKKLDKLRKGILQKALAGGRFSNILSLGKGKGLSMPAAATSRAAVRTSDGGEAKAAAAAAASAAATEAEKIRQDLQQERTKKKEMEAKMAELEDALKQEKDAVKQAKEEAETAKRQAEEHRQKAATAKSGAAAGTSDGGEAAAAAAAAVSAATTEAEKIRQDLQQERTKKKEMEAKMAELEDAVKQAKEEAETAKRQAQEQEHRQKAKEVAVAGGSDPDALKAREELERTKKQMADQAVRLEAEIARVKAEKADAERRAARAAAATSAANSPRAGYGQENRDPEKVRVCCCYHFFVRIATRRMLRCFCSPSLFCLFCMYVMLPCWLGFFLSLTSLLWCCASTRRRRPAN